MKRFRTCGLITLNCDIICIFFFFFFFFFFNRYTSIWDFYILFCLSYNIVIQKEIIPKKIILNTSFIQFGRFSCFVVIFSNNQSVAFIPSLQHFRHVTPSLHSQRQLMGRGRLQRRSRRGYRGQRHPLSLLHPVMQTCQLLQASPR